MQLFLVHFSWEKPRVLGREKKKRWDWAGWGAGRVTVDDVDMRLNFLVQQREKRKFIPLYYLHFLVYVGENGQLLKYQKLTKL